MAKILFIEDDPVLSRVYCKAMAAAGFEVQHAADGEAGLTILQVMRPDLILLDLMLPRISGMDLLRIIRGSEDIKDTPVIVFSSAFRNDVREEVEKLGANRLLPKSEFVPKQVIAVIKELLPGGVRRIAGASSDPGVIAEAGARIPQLLRASGQLIQEVNREVGSDRRGGRLRALKSTVCDLADVAITLDMAAAAYFCEALDALLGEASDRVGKLGPAGLRTITQAVDFLADVFDPQSRFGFTGFPAFNILIMDDDSISRCGVQLALSKIKQKGQECARAPEALARCKEQAFDLIFLDVGLPDMNGFDLCAEIRRAGASRSAPVIFVTQHTDLQIRAQASLSGGTDFISKPFHFMELAVKSLFHLLRSKLH
jgi:DNA-binding response OmpR family regulator